jgi:hypothetical protein
VALEARRLSRGAGVARAVACLGEPPRGSRLSNRLTRGPIVRPGVKSFGQRSNDSNRTFVLMNRWWRARRARRRVARAGAEAADWRKEGPPGRRAVPGAMRWGPRPSSGCLFGPGESLGCGASRAEVRAATAVRRVEECEAAATSSRLLDFVDYVRAFTGLDTAVCAAVHYPSADRGRVVKADIPCSLGGGRRGFDPCQLRRTKRAFFPPLAIEMKLSPCHQTYICVFNVSNPD